MSTETLVAVSPSVPLQHQLTCRAVTTLSALASAIDPALGRNTQGTLTSHVVKLEYRRGRMGASCAFDVMAP